MTAAKQRVVLVTGGMGGLGETISTKMVDAGYKVVVTYSPGNTKSAEWVADMVLISMATPWISDVVRERWFALPEIIALMAIPLMTALLLLAVRGLLNSHVVRGPACWLPFVLLIAVFVFGFLGLAYSIYPFVVIGQLTIWQAASSPQALKVILIGVCISVPAIAGYTVFSYRVFRGKTGELRYA